MTACVNRKHTKKVAAVVTASLVGALSLGAAPVAAVADTGIETLAVTWNTGASITKANDGRGASVSNPNRATFAEGSGKYLVPTEVANDYATTDVDSSEYTLEYQKFNSSTNTWGSTFTNAETHFGTATNCTGTYRVRVTKAGTSESTPWVAFKYVSGENALDGAYAYTTDPESSEIVYDGTTTFDDVKFADSEGYSLSDASGSSVLVDWYEADGTRITATSSAMDAGTYTAKVAYTDADGVRSTANIKVTISALDLSTASVVRPDGIVPADNDAFLNGLEINGVPAATANTFLKVTSISAPDGSSNFLATGKYTVTVAAKNNNGNVKGSVQVTFNALNTDLTGTMQVIYGRSTNLTGTTKASPYVVYLADGESFDASKLSVKSDSTATATTYKADDIEISYSDGSKAVDASALTQPGTYAVTVRIKPVQDFATNQWTGGSKTVWVKIQGNEVDANETLAFYLDGELASSYEQVTFDGHDFLNDVSAIVKDSDGTTYEEGTDYTLEVTKDGKKVDSIVDKGVYTITVKPVTFNIASGTQSFQIEVLAVKPDQLIADVEATKYNADENTGDIYNVTDEDGNSVVNTFYVAYTGSAIEVPGVLYGVTDSATGKVTYTELPSDLYNIVNIKKGSQTVKEIKDKGTYTVKIALSDAAGSNYDLVNGDTFTIEVREFGHFADVQPNAWYATAVEKAYDELYINGISGTNLFAPEADITRADAVCILFNMAGGVVGSNDFQYNENTGYNTGFSDVDGHAYFAKALAWAHASGVANGSNGEFRPYDQITREEFASLLANFAKSKGEFVAADESALDGMSDANTVSDWAEDNVAWAVENGVMGNGGFVAGQSNIKRAEVAAMAVNYQPENLTGEVRPTR